MSTQVILGAGGAIGTELSKALRQYTNSIRLVSRNPVRVNPEDELFPANLLNPSEVKEAVKGAEIVYLTVGFKYSLNEWKNSWPALITNVISACKEEGCKLVFFDNVYMYDAASTGNMTEETPVKPPSRKGQIRAEIAESILKEARTSSLTALIARSADFYGPGIKSSSMLTETVIKPLSEGKKAMWIGNPDALHSFTYTPDAAKATALLGNTPEAYDQVWHLPTSTETLTGRQWIEIFAEHFGTRSKFRRISSGLVRLMGIFMPFMRELSEMMYQYNKDYVFDSSKFRKRFELEATPPFRAIAEILEKDHQKLKKSNKPVDLVV